MSLSRLKSAAASLRSLPGLASTVGAAVIASGTDAALAPMPFWQARSFWLTLVTILVTVFGAPATDLIAALGFADVTQAVDWIMATLPVVTALWAWLERRAPTRRLVLSTGG